MVERTNSVWLEDLHAGGEQQALALEDLRAVILHGLPYALAGKLTPGSPELEALAEEVAQETLLRVLDHLDTFEGRSAFTTWVQKIAIRQALSELRRRRWRDVPLPEMEMGDESEGSFHDFPDNQPSPEVLIERKDLMMRVNQIIMEELTEKQRMALMAVAMKGLTLEETAHQMGMNRNAIYKLMHDARLRLKHQLEADGFSTQQAMGTFDKVAG